MLKVLSLEHSIACRRRMHESNRLSWYFRKSMKLPGFLLLLAGWVIVLTAIAILPPGSARGAFLLAGLGVQGLGLALVVRGHMPEPPRERALERGGEG
jgi:hypothetical protein